MPVAARLETIDAGSKQRRGGALPRVLIVGSEDVDARLELMGRLADEFQLAAAGSAPELGQRFRASGFDYFCYPLKRAVAPLKDLHTLAALARLFRQARPALVHCFDTKPCVYGRLAARLAGVPAVVGTLPGLGSLYVAGQRRSLVRGVYEKLQAWASHRADLTIFQNGDDAREFVGRGVVPADRYEVIPGSGVRTDVFNPANIPEEDRLRLRGELGIPAESVLVTMVSRIIPAKGVEEFVAAAGAVRQQHPNVRFLLVGPPDSGSVERYRPEQLAAFARAVNWPGPRRDVPRVLAASDVFVLPSFYREGIPRCLLEAASMGLPLVTTRSPGCAEVVEEGGNGFLVPVRDGAALTGALLPLVADAELRRRLGRRSRALAVARFDLDRIAAQTRAVYHRLLTQCLSRNGVSA